MVSEEGEVIMRRIIAGIAAILAVVGLVECNTRKTDSIHVERVESSPGFYLEHYMKGGKCIAEVFSPDGMETALHEADIDGDGNNEYVAECVYADGGRRILVYRVKGSDIEVARFIRDYEAMPGMVAECYDEAATEFYAVNGDEVMELSPSELYFMDFECSKDY